MNVAAANDDQWNSMLLSWFSLYRLLSVFAVLLQLAQPQAPEAPQSMPRCDNTRIQCSTKPDRFITQDEVGHSGRQIGSSV